MQNRILKTLTTVLVTMLVGLSLSCASKKEPDKMALLMLFLLTGEASANNGAFYARIFQMGTDIRTNTTASNMTVPGTPDAAKKKLILVHGWKAGDSESAGKPSDDQLKQRILDTYNTFLTANDGTGVQAYITANYDVYGFTYLTADAIDTNGARFRSRLDELFGSVNNDTVHVLAHSMGGLVTRFAMYEGSNPAYLKRVVAMGTPWHGTPWASTQFQADFGVIGTAIGGQMTSTAGGRDLAWDNYNSMTGGYSNIKLTNINGKADTRDEKIYKAYGAINNNSGNAPTTGFTSACRLLDAAGFGATNASDCVVPQDSANFANNAFVKNLQNQAAYTAHDHKVINLENDTNSLRTNVLATMQL